MPLVFIFVTVVAFFVELQTTEGSFVLEDSVSMPLWLNFRISPLCQTLSKALNMSKNAPFNRYHYQKVDIFRG